MIFFGFTTTRSQSGLTSAASGCDILMALGRSRCHTIRGALATSMPSPLATACRLGHLPSLAASKWYGARTRVAKWYGAATKRKHGKEIQRHGQAGADFMVFCHFGLSCKQKPGRGFEVSTRCAGAAHKCLPKWSLVVRGLLVPKNFHFQICNFLFGQIYRALNIVKQQN